MKQKGVNLRRVNITSPEAQQTMRRIGAGSCIVALVFAAIAYMTVFQRGLGETGILILLCIAAAGVGGFGYTQPSFPRTSVMFGYIPCRPPRTMIEPGWPIGGALATLVLAVYIIATA